jgi:cystathionine gamma-synthase
MHDDSLLVRGIGDSPTGGLAPILDRSSTYERWPPEAAPPYGRGHSPTAREAEALLGALEEATSLAFASGMTAWADLCLATLGGGRALVIPNAGYYEVELLGAQLLARFGVEVRRYDPLDAEGFARACEGASLALVETPSNPLMRVTDIARAAASAHAGGALLCCDNTMCTPLLQRPLDLGADVAWQSATKYLNGHSDALGGVLSLRDPELVERVRAVRRMTGGILAPDPSWLLLRGMRTLALRVPRQSAGGLELARRLAGHPGVTRVHYPGLPDHPGHEIASRQMHGGFGGLLSFELADAAAAERAEGGLRLIRRATSLGGVESLCERRDRFEPSGRVPPGLLRLAVGLEHVEDLWEDLEQAIAGAPA